jgi:hypothetical protein
MNLKGPWKWGMAIHQGVGEWTHAFFCAIPRPAEGGRKKKSPGNQPGGLNALSDGNA